MDGTTTNLSISRLDLNYVKVVLLISDGRDLKKKQKELIKLIVCL